MKYTIFVTHQCNLACDYCYVRKSTSKLTIPLAEKIVDFIFKDATDLPNINIGLFGGEPLLEFELTRSVVDIIKKHSSSVPGNVELTLVSNGTIFSDDIAEFLIQNNINFCLSCDGPSFVQDKFRRFPDGNGSSEIVEQTINKAADILDSVLVNSVYNPCTFRYLPLTIEYLYSLGLRQLYLNPDFSTSWSEKEAEELPRIYEAVAGKYIEYYLRHEPAFISPIDSKIAAILRGGYCSSERCQMGVHELAFSASGNIYPCERLAGDGGDNAHCIGNIFEGVDTARMACHNLPYQEINPECISCGIRNYCMNWCGCSNYFSSGYYNKVGPFICHSEKAMIGVAFEVIQTLEKQLGPTFFEHLSGSPSMNSLIKI